LTRVLFLTESFHPVLGGGEQHIRDLGRRLVAAGMPASVLTRRGDTAWPAEEILDGIRVLRAGPPGPGRTGKYAMVPAALLALARERATYDVLVVRGTRVLGLPGLVTGRALGKSVVLQPELNGEMSGEVYTWGTPLAGGLTDRMTRGAVAWRNTLMRDADAFVAMSRRIRDEFLEAGVPEEKIAHIPHGVDTDRFRPAAAEERLALRRRLGLPGQGWLVTFTGRLLRGKGLETLVDAFARVAPDSPSAHLVLVGSGVGQALSVEDDLKRQVESAGLRRRVTFTGRVEDVSDYLRASDVFVFPSEFEALGISLVEAAACGLPCLGSRTGGIVDVIEEGRSGLLFRPGDAQELAAGLRRLLGDGGAREAMGAHARSVARDRFDARDMCDRYLGLFREVHCAR
jgi:glycosyltransferase involved in cell wall biosynthesis